MAKSTRFVIPKNVARLIRPALVATRYGGSQYWCPICDMRFRRLAAYNGVPSMACPNCGARQRHRMLSLYLDREIGLASLPLRVLHVSPELGLSRRLRAMGNIEYTSLDLLRDGVTVRGNLQALPLRSGSFDLVICSHVLEHVDDDIVAARELTRVTMPVIGRLLVMVPVDFDRASTFEDTSIVSPEGRREAFGQRDHVRLFGSDVVSRLEHAGAAVDQVDYARDLPSELAASLALTPGTDLIYVCTNTANQTEASRD